MNPRTFNDLRQARRKAAKCRQPQQGFSLLEVLATLTLTSLALLGAAGLQLRALQTGQSSQARTQAILLASDMAERIEANKAAATLGAYVFDSNHAPTTATDCSGTACSPAELSAYDLGQWHAQIKKLLPQASFWSVRAPSGISNPMTYTIVIQWNDRRVQANYDGAVGGPGEEMSYQATRTVYYQP